MKNKHIVKSVSENSIASELGIEPGDCLVSINGEPIEDIFDYQFLSTEEELVLVVEDSHGEQWELEIEKDMDEDLGLVFEQGLMDEYHSCRNKCMFCFIDQMPEGMRDTLYFKDDDSRLSFLQGNYITLTNMTDDDVKRIVKYHLEPINISFHTTNPELRCKMLNNRFAGDALKKIDILYEGGITMNGQIVLCPGVNDGEELERSIEDMSKYLPNLQSVSIVPVGLTKYREGLYPLRAFTKEEAIKVLEMIHRWQDKIVKDHGTHFIHASDEWYITAGLEVPNEEQYDGYLQLENGVGMLRLLENEIEEELASLESSEKAKTISIATGTLIQGNLKQLIEKIEKKLPNYIIHVYPIVNHFFGEEITVTGLITGKDLIAQLKGKELGEKLLLSCNMFRSGEEVFLDDVTRKDVEEALQVKISIVESSGYDLIKKITE